MNIFKKNSDGNPTIFQYIICVIILVCMGFGIKGMISELMNYDDVIFEDGFNSGYDAGIVLGNYECLDGCFFAEHIIYKNITLNKPTHIYQECVEMCINDSINWYGILR